MEPNDGARRGRSGGGRSNHRTVDRGASPWPCRWLRTARNSGRQGPVGVPPERPGDHRASSWRGDQAAPEETKRGSAMNEAFLKSRPEAATALSKCFANPKTVLACVELLARLNGELP